MRLAFMGTPDFATPTLNALIAAGHDVVAVYSQPPARAGRGKQERKSPVHIQAESAGIEVRTPLSMRDSDAIADFKSLNLDACVVVAYGQILPQAILDAPKYGCVNVHASLLPRWRGAAPIHRALMAGDSETGVGIMVMEAGLDTGPVLAEAKTIITDSDTTLDLHDKLAKMGADLISPTLEGFIAGDITPTPQASHGVTYAKKIEKAEARIDWTRSATEIDRQVRGLNPFPGAWTMINGERVKILAGQIGGASGAVGTAVDDMLTFACDKGSYQIERAQRAGKGAMDREQFLNGYDVPKGTKAS